jgi:hypothetical protein
VRKHIPSFLSAQMESVSRAVDASHHAVVLEDVVLTVKDALTIADVLIPPERDRDPRKQKLKQLDALQSPR